MGANSMAPRLEVQPFRLPWVFVGGPFPPLNALGVWQKENQHAYEYTWIAYGLDAAGLPV